MEQQINYFAVIPANIRYDKDLIPNAKLLYGEITALCNQKGYCWASNSYFAELYGVSKETISRWLNNLESKGHVNVELIYKSGSKEIKERRIYITPIDENINTLLTKSSIPYRQNRQYPIDENVKENNTVSNNTFNNTLKEYNRPSTKIPYKKIISEFNKICTTLPNIENIKGNRQRTVRAWYRTLKNGMDDVIDFFHMVHDSDFLSGRSGRWTNCSFDWIVKPSNRQKIIEGNYRNEKNQKKSSNIFFEILEEEGKL